ncbi:MAG: 50S ribosomal protein L11 methyltransferase [Bacteroidales bacterium]|nr:50S ribosomal protein L11 methyltransferase [Bacteroidales bacterium]MDD4671230.1 50S ribosomal protein L11 methyltransferase [Bacteroidales bacterium]
MDYIEVRLSIKPFSEENAEIVMAQIEELGFESFSVEEPLLKAYIRREQFSAPNLKTMLSVFSSISSILHVTFTTELIREQNWNALWESDFQPVVIAGKCTIKAPYHKDLPKTRYQIVIDPKMAFGTGHHQTTYLMMEALLEEGAHLKGLQVMDMGCGTGVLAILAAKMGALSPVHSIDIDHTAVTSAQKNARRNRVSSKVITLCGDASLLQAGKYDLILANINRNILLEDMSTYSRSLKMGGMLFISGFYTQDIPMLVKEAGLNGLSYLSQMEKENWAVVKFVKK